MLFVLVHLLINPKTKFTHTHLHTHTHTHTYTHTYHSELLGHSNLPIHIIILVVCPREGDLQISGIVVKTTPYVKLVILDHTSIDLLHYLNLKVTLLATPDPPLKTPSRKL